MLQKKGECVDLGDNMRTAPVGPEPLLGTFESCVKLIGTGCKEVAIGGRERFTTHPVKVQPKRTVRFSIGSPVFYPNPV